MKRLAPLAFALLLAVALSASLQSWAFPRGGGAASGGGGAPAAPTGVLLTQATSGCTVNQGSFTGCTTNTQYLNWTASSGATSYTILRNGSSLATGVTCCTYTDSTATNTNIGNGFGTETAYAYQVEAVNGSGPSTGVYPNTYFFLNGVPQQNNGNAAACAQNYSNGSNTFTATTTESSQVITVTAITSNYVTPFQAISSGTGYATYGAEILPFGTGGTSGTGATGTYETSVAASASGSTTINTSINNCVDQLYPQTGATYDMALGVGPPYGNGQMQLFASSPLAPQYDLNLGGFNNVTMDVKVTDTSESLKFAIHSRPGANANGTGDLFSHYTFNVFSGTTPGTDVTCTPTLAVNQYSTCVFPLKDIGMGAGTFTGSVNDNWHGLATFSGGTATITSTVDGNSANIAIGDIIVQGNSSSGVCHATSVVSGSAFSVSGCNGGSGVQTYDVQMTVTSTCTGTPVDNGGYVQDVGTTMPAGVYVGSDNAGGASIATCANAASATWGLGAGNNETIPSVSSTTINFQRFSAYKPALEPQQSGATYGAVHIDNFGWTH